jgi:phosphatidylglycerophosphatase A
MISFLKRLLGSGFGTGYLPYAPGTFGSLASLSIFLIPGFANLYIILPITFITFLVGIQLGNYFETIYNKDPKQFTLDEFVGTWITFLFIPQNLMQFIIGFIVWRILDIVKPFPANKSESLKGGLGIMMDDVVSGLYSLVIMVIFNFIFFR